MTNKNDEHLAKQNADGEKTKRKFPEGFGVGSKKSRFRRKLSRWTVKNPVLYGLMLFKGITPKMMATHCSCNIRSVQKWLYDGVRPHDDKIQIISQVLGVSPHVLFPEK